LFGIGAAGGATLLLAATEAGQAKAEELDGELLAACDAWWANIAETDALLNPVEHLPSNHPDAKLAWARHWNELNPRVHELKWQIAEMAARTPEGLRAKARAARRMLNYGLDGGVMDDDALYASVLHDILGLPPAVVEGGNEEEE
jgi:hypothetical protein